MKNIIMPDGFKAEKYYTLPDGSQVFTNAESSDGTESEKTIKRTDGSIAMINVRLPEGGTAEKFVYNSDGTQIALNYVDHNGTRTKETIVMPDGGSLSKNLVYADGSTIEELITYSDGTLKGKNGINSMCKYEEMTIDSNNEFSTYINVTFFSNGLTYSKLVRDKNGAVVSAESMKEEPTPIYNENKEKTTINENKEKTIIHGTIEICEYCRYYDINYDECEHDRDCEYQQKK